MQLGKSLDWETGALANILENRGFVNPLTSLPFTETELLGLGGGIGAGYFMFQFGGEVAVVVGVRRAWQHYKGEFIEQIAERIGLEATPWQGGPKSAHQALQKEVEAGRPAWVTCAEAALSHRGWTADFEKYYVYGLGVYELTDEGWICDDRGIEVTVGTQAMQHSRAIITANKSRMMLFGGIKSTDLKEAITLSIRQCAHELLNPPIKNFGLAALEKWAKTMVNPKDSKGWPQVITTTRGHFATMNSIYRHQHEEGCRKGMRDIYAQYLRAAGHPECADAYDDCAESWGSFTDMLLPPVDDGVRNLRRLHQEIDELLATRAGREAVLAKRKQLAKQLEDESLGIGFDFADHRAQLSDALIKIAKKEQAAVEKLASI